MNREILFVIPGSGDEVVAQRAVIESDTKASDLLQAAHLDPTAWNLQVRKGDEMVTLAAAETLLPHVESGEKIFAFPKNVVVGAA